MNSTLRKMGSWHLRKQFPLIKMGETAGSTNSCMEYAGARGGRYRGKLERRGGKSETPGSLLLARSGKLVFPRRPPKFLIYIKSKCRVWLSWVGVRIGVTGLPPDPMNHVKMKGPLELLLFPLWKLVTSTQLVQKKSESACPYWSDGNERLNHVE